MNLTNLVDNVLFPPFRCNMRCQVLGELHACFRCMPDQAHTLLPVGSFLCLLQLSDNLFLLVDDASTQHKITTYSAPK